MDDLQNHGDAFRPLPALRREEAEQAYRAAVAVYVRTRRERVPEFVRRHFAVRGSLRIHRAALGWDLLRAPANIALALPHLLKFLLVALLRQAGAGSLAVRLAALRTQIPTDVEREVEWLIWSELLELPYAQHGRSSQRDALADILLAQPVVARKMASLGEAFPAAVANPVFRLRLADNLQRYTGARNAAAEIATAFASAGAGGFAVQQLTPTAISLGPPLAALIAHQTAVLAFPLGQGVGGAWYDLFPPDPSIGLVVGVTGILIAVSAVVAALAGIVADPVQRVFGIHRRRLDGLVAAVGVDLSGEGAGNFRVRAHYVARLFDFFEAVRLAVRAAV